MESSRRHCNELGGKQWLRNSISVWSDIRKSAEEARFKHPAMFPGMLVERLIETFLPPDGTTVLDPFAGSGSTIVTAASLRKCGVGLELSSEYVALAEERLRAIEPRSEVRVQRSEVGQTSKVGPTSDFRPLTSGIIHASAAELREHVAVDSIDLCITSPPYWDILTRKRTADSKAVRNYGENAGDLGTISDYNAFLDALANVFGQVFAVLKPGAHDALCDFCQVVFV